MYKINLNKEINIPEIINMDFETFKKDIVINKEVKKNIKCTIVIYLEKAYGDLIEKKNMLGLLYEKSSAVEKGKIQDLILELFKFMQNIEIKVTLLKEVLNQ